MGCLAAAALRAAADTGTNTNALWYTLDDCLASGLERSARVANATRDVASAEERIRQVRARILPTLAVGVSDSWQKSAVAGPGDGSLEQEYADAWSVGAGLQQLLYDGGSVRAALGAAGAYRGLAAAAAVQARAEVARDIRLAFVDLLLAEASVRVREQSLTQLTSLAEQVDARFRQGLVPEFERNSARVRLANEQPLLIRSQAAVEVARSQLRHQARLDDRFAGVRGELRYEPFAPTLAELRREALAWRPEVAQARRRVELAVADVRVSQGRYAPELRARAGYQGNNPPPGESADEWAWGWTAAVTLDWALYDGGLREADIAAKRIEVAKAEEDEAELQRLIQLELETLDAARRGAAAVVAATEQSVGLAEQTLTIAQARYGAGLATYLDFTDAQQALRNAQLARLEAVATHARSVAALICARGDPAALARIEE